MQQACKILALGIILAIAAAASAQPSNVLIASDPSDSFLPVRPESKGVAVSATGDIYVMVARGGSIREMGIWRSTDLGQSWVSAGATLGPASKGSMVFDSTGTVLNVIYSERSGAFPRVVFNRFDTTTSTWTQPADTLLFSGSFHFNADDIERTADDHILVVAETYQASPSQGLYYRIFDGVAWDPDPGVDPDGIRLDMTYTAGIHAAVTLDRTLPAASSEALIIYRSGTGSYGRIETRLHLGTRVIGPETPLSGQGPGFLAGSADDRTANLQNIMRLPTGEVFMAFTANNSSNTNSRVRMGRRDSAGAWTFHDVGSPSNYQHGNADFNDVAVGLADGQVAVYYGKNTYSGSLSAQNGSGVYRKLWDPLTSTFGAEVQIAVANQNGTLGFLCVPRDPVPGLREFLVYRDNTTDLDVYAYRDPFALAVRTVSSTYATVYPGQTGIDLDVTVENTGTNPLDSLSATLSFTDSMGVDRTSEYSVMPAPGLPTMIPPGGTQVLVWAIDVLPSAVPGTITVDASAAAIDTVTMQALVDPDADTPHVWTVQGCGYSLCGDCDGNLRVDILDALLAAQVAAGLTAAPTSGSPQFNACNVQGDVFPNPMAVISVLDALDLARFAAGLTTLSCC